MISFKCQKNEHHGEKTVKYIHSNYDNMEFKKTWQEW